MNKNILTNEDNALLKVVLVGVNASFNHTNLAIRCLKQYCVEKNNQKEKVEIICKEFTINDSIRENIASLLDENANVYAFSCYIWNTTIILEMTEILKKLKPDCVIILGGPEVSYENDEFLQLHVEVDYIIRGPGEKAFSDLISKLSIIASQSMHPSESAIFEDQPDSSLSTQPSDSHISDRLTDSLQSTNSSHSSLYKNQLNHTNPERIIDGKAIPLGETSFVYTPLDFVVKQKQYYYETTRGCPFNCSYCLSSITKEVDSLSIERVKNEMEFFIHQKIKQVKLVDRTFNYDNKRSIEIWKFLIEKYNKKPFHTNFHFEIAADLLSQEALSILQEAPDGLFQFEIGVQTTNLVVLEKIKRKSSLNKIYENVIKLKQKANIPLHLDLIAGLPGEDWQSFKQSFCDVFALRPDMLQLGFLKVLKGSPIREEAIKFGLVYPDRPPYEILSTESMSFYELIKLKNIANLVERYYNSKLFKYSLEYLLTFFSNSFEVFEKFENQWDEKGLFKRNSSRQEIIRELYLFGKTVIVNHGNELDTIENSKQQFDLFCDLLKFDYYCFDKKGNIDELDMNFGNHHPALPRNLEKESWYKENGQPVCIKPRLERYVFDVDKLVESNQFLHCISYVLYEMNGDRPVIFDSIVFN